jgi:hypothetical protein
VQIAVDTQHHLIVAHEVTNVGSDRNQLSNIAEQARTEIGAETLDVVADRGYYDGEEIMSCEESGITVMLPKPMTSGAKAAGRFGKQDFVYIAAYDVYRCPAGQRLTYFMKGEDDETEMRQTLPAEDQRTASASQDLSILAAALADRPAEPSLVRRHHLHPDAANLPCGLSCLISCYK